ncbi:MAG: hypothetical protein WDO71_13250 [Bacteroidota bacterium]
MRTKPLIEVKSYNSKEISQHGQLTIRLNYFDKEGDLGKGDFFAVRKPAQRFTARYQRC